MIRRIVRAIRDLRIAHYNRLACAQGMQILRAQQRRDWRAAGGHMQAMHAAQAKRDRLIDKVRLELLRESAQLFGDGETCPACLPGCQNGNTCLRNPR